MAVAGTDEFGDYFVLLLFPSRFMDLYWFLCLDACAAPYCTGGGWVESGGLARLEWVIACEHPCEGASINW